MQANKQLLYIDIAQKIKDNINAGVYKPGKSIPTEDYISKTLKVSRVTVRKAISVLKNEGILYTVKGSGTFVKTNSVSHDFLKLYSFHEIAERSNKTARNQILNFSITTVPVNITESLQIKPDDQVIYVELLRYLDNIAVVLEKSYMPLSIFNDYSYNDALNSKYKYIENKGYKIHGSSQKILPILPDTNLQELLNLTSTTPILKVVTVSSLSDQRIFECTELFFNPNHYEFTVNPIRHST